MSPFLAWGDFHARSHFSRSTIPEEKWGTTRSLLVCEQKLYPTWFSCWRKRYLVQRSRLRNIENIPRILLKIVWKNSWHGRFLYISLFLNVTLNSLRGTNVLNALFPGGGGNAIYGLYRHVPL